MLTWVRSTSMTDMNESQSKSSNYELKSDAVEKLLDAQEGKVEDYSQEELEKYRSKKLGIPHWVKMIFIKAWFAGAVCFFFLFGLSGYLPGQLDLLFVAGAALGMATDLLTNNVIRFMEKEPGENDKWMMVPGKGTGSMLLNVLYYLVVILFVFMLYNVINLGINTMTGDMDAVPLGVEPILFGVFCTAFDVMFISIKHLVIRIVKKD